MRNTCTDATPHILNTFIASSGSVAASRVTVSKVISSSTPSLTALKRDSTCHPTRKRKAKHEHKVQSRSGKQFDPPPAPSAGAGNDGAVGDRALIRRR